MDVMQADAIRKSIVVPLTAEEAFRLFTDGIASWWPIATHSVAEDEAETCVLEARIGGRFYERTKSGEEHLWGTVTVCEPPDRLVCTWHPGRDASTAQEVELRFEAEADGTRVELVHTGWKHYGEGRDRAFAEYVTGWERVFVECYGQAATA